MDVKTKNELLFRGKIDESGLFPQLKTLASMPLQFSYDFGLDQLPDEPGLVLIRGARQLGKSTWMELQLRRSVHENGPATAFYLNGDSILDSIVLYDEIKSLVALFQASGSKRIFIDEITAVPKWENAIKRLYDEGITREVLIITTGSKAVDLRRGTERLPGRKGRLARSNFIFHPISFSEFARLCRPHFGEATLNAYLLTGGSPLAANELLRTGQLPGYIIELTRDWIFGECSAQGRSRNLLNWVLQALLTRGGAPVPLAKLARESGAANNSVVHGYIELLSDLLCISTSHPIESSTGRPIPRKAFKYHFVNLLAATSFHPAQPRTLSDFQGLSEPDQARWYEWVVAQKLWRDAAIQGVESPEVQFFWQSSEHEIDFRKSPGQWIEVKRGKSEPMEFRWFSKVFPKAHLKVICSTPFSTPLIQGVSLEEFLGGGFVGA